MENNIKPGDIRAFLKAWREDYVYKTLVSAGASFACTALFALYHGYLGLRYSSVWHSSICVFYFLLMMIRGSILLTEKKNQGLPETKKELSRHRTFLLSSAMMVALDLSLMLPLALMVTQATPVTMGLIPAIAMAAHTTYKIILASIYFRREKRNPCSNLLVWELRMVHFIDALVSLLTLQNTLIMVNRKHDAANDMFYVSAVSSAVIYAVIVIVTVSMLLQGRRKMVPDTRSDRC